MEKIMPSMLAIYSLQLSQPREQYLQGYADNQQCSLRWVEPSHSFQREQQ